VGRDDRPLGREHVDLVDLDQPREDSAGVCRRERHARVARDAGQLREAGAGDRAVADRAAHPARQPDLLLRE
jgi:hypothetical protein